MKTIEKIDTILPKCLERMRVAQCENGISGISSGFHNFDSVTAGLHGGELVTIGGRPSTGKTAFLLSMLKNIAMQNIPVLLFSLEMSRNHIINRLVSQGCEIPLNHINKGCLTAEEWESLDNKINKIQNIPFYMETSSFLSIEDVCTQSSKAVKDLGVKLIAIDYIQLLYYNYGSADNRYLDINYFTRTLKNLSKELDVPIVIVSQLNRETENRNNYGNSIESIRPQLTDLRDSGTICDDSDIIVFLSRPELYNIYEDSCGRNLCGTAECIIAKNRNGKRNTFFMKFNSQFASFDDIPRQ